MGGGTRRLGRSAGSLALVRSAWRSASATPSSTCPDKQKPATFVAEILGDMAARWTNQ